MHDVVEKNDVGSPARHVTVTAASAPRRSMMACIAAIAMLITGTAVAGLSPLAQAEQTNSSVTVNKSKAEVTNNPDGTTARLDWDVTVTNNTDEPITSGTLTDRMSSSARDVTARRHASLGDVQLAAQDQGFVSDSSGKLWVLQYDYSGDAFSSSLDEITWPQGIEEPSFADDIRLSGNDYGFSLITDASGTLWQLTEDGDAAVVPGLEGVRFIDDIRCYETSDGVYVSDVNGDLWHVDYDGSASPVSASDGSQLPSFPPDIRFPSVGVVSDDDGGLWNLDYQGTATLVDFQDEDGSAVEAPRFDGVKHEFQNGYISDIDNVLWYLSSGSAQPVAFADAEGATLPAASFDGVRLDGQDDAISTDVDGILWIFSSGTAVPVAFEDDSGEPIGAPTFEGALQVSFIRLAVLSDTDGTLWAVFGDYAQTYEYRQQDGSPITQAPRFRSDVRISLNAYDYGTSVTDQSGTLWSVGGALDLATAVKVVQEDGSPVTFVDDIRREADGGVLVVADTSGNLWFTNPSASTLERVPGLTDVKFENTVRIARDIGTYWSIGYVTDVTGALWGMDPSAYVFDTVALDVSAVSQRVYDLVPQSEQPVEAFDGTALTERTYSLPYVASGESVVVHVSATVDRPQASGDPVVHSAGDDALVVVNQAFFDAESAPSGEISPPVTPSVAVAREQLDGLQGNESCPVGEDVNGPCDQVPAIIESLPGEPSTGEGGSQGDLANTGTSMSMPVLVMFLLLLAGAAALCERRTLTSPK